MACTKTMVRTQAPRHAADMRYLFEEVGQGVTKLQLTLLLLLLHKTECGQAGVQTRAASQPGSAITVISVGYKSYKP